MRLNTVRKWWSQVAVGYSKRWASDGIYVRPLKYDELTREEKDIVYTYFSTGLLPRKERR